VSKVLLKERRGRKKGPKRRKITISREKKRRFSGRGEKMNVQLRVLKREGKKGEKVGGTIKKKRETISAQGKYRGASTWEAMY